MLHISQLNNPINAAIERAMAFTREYIDGWYMVREAEIPFYELCAPRFRYEQKDGQWTVYVQPVSNPEIEYKIHWVPKVGQYYMTGGGIIKPIVIPGTYIR